MIANVNRATEDDMKIRIKAWYHTGIMVSLSVMNAKTICPAAHHRGADGATVAGQCSCTSLISRAFPDLWPRGAEISFCHTIDHCRTILYYSVPYCTISRPSI